MSPLLAFMVAMSTPAMSPLAQSVLDADDREMPQPDYLEMFTNLGLGVHIIFVASSVIWLSAFGHLRSLCDTFLPSGTSMPFRNKPVVMNNGPDSAGRNRNESKGTAFGHGERLSARLRR